MVSATALQRRRLKHLREQVIISFIRACCHKLSLNIYRVGRNCLLSGHFLTKTDGNVTTIEGRITESPRKSFLIKPDPKIVTNACILCRLNLDIKHTDVLILHQFITSEGEMLPKRLTGLCRKQYHFISNLVAMAQEAGLLGNFVTWEGKFDISQRQGYKKPNTYFDESTILLKKKSKWMYTEI